MARLLGGVLVPEFRLVIRRLAQERPERSQYEPLAFQATLRGLDIQVAEPGLREFHLQ